MFTSELKAIWQDKETFEDFKKIYFKGEKVSNNNAYNFYSDYINCHKGNLKSYIEATTYNH